ncbi:MAG TPA: nucleoid-associated protein, YbaB/EbfC family, partial [Anaerolineae bacterium]|nr:nucleoid-associated protein, YbaB/EbfC family [Anaerolineae bacterium]
MAKGFNRGPAMGGGQGGMMQQIQKLQKQMEEAQAKLAEETVSATAGGGAIKVTMTGDQKCKSVEISPEFLKDADAEMLQDMI